MSKQHRRSDSWPLLAAALLGLVLTGIAVFRTAPEAEIRLASPAAAETAAVRHAEAMGFTLVDVEHARFSAGIDQDRLRDPGDVLRTFDDPDERRRALDAVPPLRVRVTLQVEGPDAGSGRLWLEIGQAGGLLGARYDPDDGGGDRPTIDNEAWEAWADEIAPSFFAEPVPDGETVGGRRRRFVSPTGKTLGIVGRPPGDWRATVTPVADVDTDDDDRLAVGLLILAVVGLAMVGFFLWRLGRGRLGFGHTKLVAAAVLLYVLASATDSEGWANLGIFIAFGAPSITLMLAAVWAVTEAEVRDYQPQLLESWDRLICRLPLRTTGTDLVAGIGWGAAMSGLYAISGVTGSWWDGGYNRVLGSPSGLLLEPIFLVASMAFGVGCGGRLLGRRGLALGVLAGAASWLFFVPVEPWLLRCAWALVLGSLGVALLVRRGLLVSTMASFTALALPNLGLVTMTWPRWWLGSLVGFGVVLAALVYGLRLAKRAPVMGSAQQVKPAYLSKLERIARLETEVELLRNFQLALLPADRVVRQAGLEAAWRMRTADQVGGDFLDFVTDEDGRVWMAIADVAGHGIACSMFTAFAKAAIAEHASSGVTPATALTRIRRLFKRLRSRRSMVTMLLAVWDPRAQTLSVASAGHPPLSVWDGEGIREIGPPSRPLGIDLPGEDRDETIVCPSGTVVLGYTDGVVEALSPFGEAFGFDRWPAILASSGGSDAQVILDGLLAAFDAHCGTTPADDDVTAVVIKVD